MTPEVLALAWTALYAATGVLIAAIGKPRGDLPLWGGSYGAAGAALMSLMLFLSL
jgi:hypothetical protein